jgi:NAD(P)-dependent dehydrogenase (short-subunit alcohol dehydrogenase family)
MQKMTRKILITGGTEGMGKFTIENLVGKLFDDSIIITCSRNEEKNNLLESSSEKIIALTVDLGEGGGIARKTYRQG